MPERPFNLGNCFGSYRFMAGKMCMARRGCGKRLLPESDLSRRSDPGTVLCAREIPRGRVDGSERIRVAEPRLPLDPRSGWRDVDRPPLVLQLRQRAGGEDVRRRFEEEGRPRADAACALLVPLGRRVYLG